MIEPTGASGQKLTPVQWLICSIAAIGFAFDIYELLMLPLIVKPAVASLAASSGLIDQLVAGGMSRGEAEILYAPGGEQYIKWARTLFFVPAIAGGVFGLLGGYLTDWLGRRRVLTFSILLYAFAAFAAGFSTSLPQLLFLRCLVFIGVCVEFVAAVAWLAELFPDHHQREKVLGYTQAFSSFGGLLVGVAFWVAAAAAEHLPAIRGVHEAWRYTLISGVIPAIPLLLIRPFLPESPAWQQKKAAGTLRRPNIAALFSPQLIRTTVLTTIVFASSYGIAFGAIQQVPQILGAGGLGKGETPRGHAKMIEAARSGVQKEIATAKEKGKTLTPAQIRTAGANASDEQVAKVTLYQEVGGLVGRFMLAILAVQILSRRLLLRIFQLPSLLFVPLFFWWMSTKLNNADSLLWIKLGMFVAGFFTVAQFSFWGNYIPLVFPTHLRGTGESFAANIGGRVIGTAAAFITLTLSESKPPNPAKIAMVGAVVAGVYVLIGAILTHWLPEPGIKHSLEEGH